MTDIQISNEDVGFKTILQPTPQTEIIKLWLSLSAKQHRNPCFGPPPVYQDLSTRHDWPIKNAIVDLPMKLKSNRFFHIFRYRSQLKVEKQWKSQLNTHFRSLLSPLGAQNKDIGAASQTSPTGVR